MNLLFITTEDFTYEKSSGICKKIITEVKAFRNSNFCVSYCYLKNGSVYINESGKECYIGKYCARLGKFDCYRVIKNYVKGKVYDSVYIRYALSDFNFISLLKCLKTDYTKMVIEIPTYPYKGELCGGLKDKINWTLDYLFSKKLRKYINLVTTYSPDKCIWGIQAIQIINGYDFSKTDPIDPIDDNGIIDLVAVANFGMWHGYDRLIRGLSEYYNNNGKRKFIFHIVGQGKEQDVYKEIVKDNDLREQVLFYGSLFGEDLENVYQKADMAICSLGFHRTGVFQTSELKSREYAAKGLPMIASSEIDIFEEDFPYLLKVPSNDTPIDMRSIEAFYDTTYNGKSREDIIKSIREYASLQCDVSLFLNDVIDYFKGERICDMH